MLGTKPDKRDEDVDQKSLILSQQNSSSASTVPKKIKTLKSGLDKPKRAGSARPVTNSNNNTILGTNHGLSS
jgi:hypothetical protein